MVCIAAFIILALIGVFVAAISIFRPEIGRSYLKMLKKSWGCLWKKVRLQKCETGFKDDVKNTLLAKVIVRHPKWVKPLSVVIEVVSVIIVVIAVWALLTAIKSLLALWALGSCNVTKPSACSLGGEVCSIDESEPNNPLEATGRWFEEWGEIFAAMPEKFRTYDAASYDFSYVTVGGSKGQQVSNEAQASGESQADDDLTTNEQASTEQALRPVAVDIFDPGCSVCMMSYRNQKASGFFEKYETRLVPFAIQDADGSYKFQNSELIVRYLLAAEAYRAGLAESILDPLFTEKDEVGIYYQNVFNSQYDAEEATKQLKHWLEAAGIDEAGIAKIAEIAKSQEITDAMANNRHIVEDELKIRGIPTLIYDGVKHTGLYNPE